MELYFASQDFMVPISIGLNKACIGWEKDESDVGQFYLFGMGRTVIREQSNLPIILTFQLKIPGLEPTSENFPCHPSICAVAVINSDHEEKTGDV